MGEREAGTTFITEAELLADVPPALARQPLRLELE
jgi:hypothetical protein